MSQYSDTIEMEWDGESVESNGDLLRPLATESASQSEILGLDGNTLGMDGSQVSVLEERHEVSLSGLLESHDGRGLETQVGLENPERSHERDVGRGACGSKAQSTSDNV
jgi:hypothetical protein